MRRSIIGMLGGVWLLTGSACAHAAIPSAPPQPSGTGTETAMPPSPASTDTWIAVYDVAKDPNDLEQERTQIVHTLGDPLEGSVVVSQAGCFDGLPDAYDDGDYVLAIQQGERVYLRALGQQLDGSPRFLGQVTVTCTD
jgi:hypothetical protein